MAGATPVWWLCAIPRVWRAVCWRTWRKVVRAALRANMAAGKRAKRLARIERRAAGGPQDEGESRKRASAMGSGGGRDDLDRGRPTACAELRLGASAVERYPQGLQHSQEARNEVCVRVLGRGGRLASLFALADDDVDEPTRLSTSRPFSAVHAFLEGTMLSSPSSRRTNSARDSDSARSFFCAARPDPRPAHETTPAATGPCSSRSPHRARSTVPLPRRRPLHPRRTRPRRRAPTLPAGGACPPRATRGRTRPPRARG